MDIADRPQGFRQRGGWVAGLVALLIVIAGVVVVVAVLRFFGNEDEDLLVAAPAIAANPEQYYGESNLRISGEVYRIIGPFAYTLGGPEFEDVELLVVGPPPPITTGRTDDMPLLEGDIVQIAGELQEFDRQALEDELNAELSDEIEAEFAGEPVLVAHSTALWPRFPVEQGVPTSIESLIADQGAWDDDPVTVEGEVTSILGENLFVLTGEEGGEVIIVDATGGVAPEAVVEASMLQVTGPMLSFDLAEIEGRTEIDLDDAATEGLDGQPTIIGEILQVLQ
jgi:hypothetical protein